MATSGKAARGVQETHVGRNQREARAQYNWYLIGEDGRTTASSIRYAGVGLVTQNQMVKYVRDNEPISECIVVMTFGYAMPLTVLNAYAPQAERPEAEKDAFYTKLQATCRKYNGKGPTYVVGDFVARVQVRDGEREQQVVAPYTFDAGSPNLNKRRDAVLYNRQLLVEFRKVNHMRLANA